MSLLLALVACDRGATHLTAPAAGGEAAGASTAAQPSVRADRATTLPPAVLDACELISKVSARASGARVTRRDGRIEDEFERRERAGCAVAIEGSFAALGGVAGPLAQLRDEFQARGWQEDTARSADGPDGTRFAFVNGNVICLFGGEWDGGDDSDPGYEPDDRFTAWGRCAARGD